MCEIVKGSALQLCSASDMTAMSLLGCSGRTRNRGMPVCIIEGALFSKACECCGQYFDKEQYFV